MEAELLDLVADRSEALVQLFCHNGVQTCQDVFGIWSHGDALVDELAHLHGPLDAEEAFQVSALWTIAAPKAHDHVRRVARAVAAGFPGRPPVLLAAVASDPHTKERPSGPPRPRPSSTSSCVSSCP